MTDAETKFTKGDRVKLSDEGIQMMPRMPEGRSGTVAFNYAEGNWVPVLWDGTQRARYIMPDLLEQSDD